MALNQSTGLALPQRSQLGIANNIGLPGGLAGELVATELLPRYSTLTKLGQVFTARAALQPISLAGTAMTGLILWNSSTNKDLHLLKVAGNIAVTSATTTGLALAYGKGQLSAPTGTTVASSQNCDLIGGNNGAGLAYVAATMTNAPVAQFDLLHNTAAISTTGEDPGFLIDLEGSVVVPPQMYACIVALGAATAAAAANASIKWAELPN